MIGKTANKIFIIFLFLFNFSSVLVCVWKEILWPGVQHCLLYQHAGRTSLSQLPFCSHFSIFLPFSTHFPPVLNGVANMNCLTEHAYKYVPRGVGSCVYIYTALHYAPLHPQAFLYPPMANLCVRSLTPLSSRHVAGHGHSPRAEFCPNAR